MPVGLSPESPVNIATSRGLARDRVRKRFIRYRDIGENAYFSAVYIGQLLPLDGTINATTAVSGGTTELRAVTPANISASFSMGGAVVAQKAIHPANIAASSAVSGSLSGPKALTGTISSTAAVSGSVVALRRVAPAAIAASWAVSGLVTLSKAIGPGTIAATWAVSGLVTALKAIRPASVTFSNAVSGAVTKSGAVVVPIVPADLVAPLLDNFNRADAANLGANYQRATFIAADPSIVSNQVAFPGGAEVGAVWNATSFGTDQEVAVTLAAGDTFTTHVYFMLDVQASPDDAYLIDIIFDAGSTSAGNLYVQFFRMNASAFTTLTGVTGPYAWAAGDVWSAKRTGSLLEVLRNGTTVASWTDVAPLAHGGYVGFGGRGSALVRLDNFSGGAIGTGGSPITFTNNVSGAVVAGTGGAVVPGTINSSFSLSGSLSGVAPTIPIAVARFSWRGLSREEFSNVAKTRGLARDQVRKRFIRYRDIRENLVPSPVPINVRTITPGANLTATFSVAGHVIGPKRLASNITATFAVTGPGRLVTGPPAQIGLLMLWSHGAFTPAAILPANITLSVSLAGSLRFRRAVRPAAITYSTTVAGALIAGRGIRPTTVITFTSTLAGAVIKGIPKTIFGAPSATFTLSGSVTKMAFVKGGSSTFTATLAGSVLAARPIVGAITTTFTLAGSIRSAGQFAGISISWTNTVAGAVVALKQLTGEINATSTLSGTVRRARGIFPDQVTSTTTVSGSLEFSRGIPANITFSTTLLSGNITIGAKRPISPAQITVSFLMSEEFAAIKFITPGVIAVTTTLSGSLVRERGLVATITATFSFGGRLSALKFYTFFEDRVLSVYPTQPVLLSAGEVERPSLLSAIHSSGTV